MIAVPIAFEIYEGKDLQAKVNMIDEGGASVEIKTLVDDKSWVRLSAHIQQSLDLMFQPGEIQ